MEEFDAVRTLHLVLVHDDEFVEPSLLGHSSARFVGDTLHVVTTKIDYDWLALGTQPLPLPQSDQMRVVESFTLSEDRSRLLYTMRIDDPVMLGTPMTFEKFYQYQPGITLNPYECDQDRVSLSE